MHFKYIITLVFQFYFCICLVLYSVTTTAPTLSIKLAYHHSIHQHNDQVHFIQLIEYKIYYGISKNLFLYLTRAITVNHLCFILRSLQVSTIRAEPQIHVVCAHAITAVLLGNADLHLRCIQLYSQP